MNKKKWSECKSAARLLVKLTEEVGEVAKEYINVSEATNEIHRTRAMARMCVELEHVDHISECLRNLVRTQLETPVEDRVGI